MSFAVIGIGSNTVRLSVYARGSQADDIRSKSLALPIDDLGSFVRLFSKKVMAGLASYVDAQGALSPEGVQRAAEVVSYLESIASNLGIEDTRVFATASLRDISNSADAVARIEELSGAAIEVLSCEEEAELGYSSFTHDCKVSRGIMCDIGGGSTELVCFKRNEPVQELSMPFGSLKLFRKHVEGILPTPQECERIRAYVDGVLDEHGFEHAPAYKVLCGIGGTCRAAAKLVHHLGWGDARRGSFTAEDLDALVAVLRRCDEESRNVVLRMCPDRVHTVLPGALALQTIVQRFNCRDIIVSQYGVREGYVHERIIRE